MSSRDKLIERFKSQPSDFTWSELTRLLGLFGYEEYEGRGSRKSFRADGLPRIKLHRPHPGSIVKRSALREVLKLLNEAGLL